MLQKTTLRHRILHEVMVCDDSEGASCQIIYYILSEVYPVLFVITTYVSSHLFFRVLIDSFLMFTFIEIFCFDIVAVFVKQQYSQAVNM